MAQVVAFRDAGFTQVQISKQLNISRCCVEKTIAKYKHPGIYKDFKCLERPKQLDGRDFQHLKRLIRDDECLSATKIVSDLNASFQKLVTTPTVHTYLKELNFEYVVKVKKQ